MLSGSAGVFGIKQSNCYAGFELSVGKSKNKKSCDKWGYWAMWAYFYRELATVTRKEFPDKRGGPISLSFSGELISPSSGEQGGQGDFDFVGCEGAVAIQVEADRDSYRLEGVT